MEPITRKEKFLAAAGGQSVDLPTPVTREEVFLKAIAEGGGGGSDLPDVTVADNGKILKVVNGEWTAVDMSPLVVTYTISGLPSGGVYPLTFDHTLAEINEAYNAGKEVIAKITINGYQFESQPTMHISVAIMASINMYNPDLQNLTNGTILHAYDEAEYAVLIMFPINTLTMTYDSTTNTLAIND